MKRIITLLLITALSACANVPQQVEQLEALARYHKAQNAAKIANEVYQAASISNLAASSELADSRANLDGALAK